MTDNLTPLPAMAQIPTSVPPAVLLANHLKALKLPTFVREYEKVAFEAAQDRADYPRYLLRLCELERIDRERRMVERRIRIAKFPHTKSFDTFDFTAQPSLNKALVLELARGEWIEQRRNVIALGPSGTGKTHAALALDSRKRKPISCASGASAAKGLRIKDPVPGESRRTVSVLSSAERRRAGSPRRTRCYPCDRPATIPQSGEGSRREEQVPIRAFPAKCARHS